MKERFQGIETKQILHISTIWVVAGLVFIGIFANGWTYDDFPVIVENPDIRSIGAFLADSYPGRPLRELTFLLDHALFGLDPYWWHLQQIFWHALNGSLLYCLTKHLTGNRTVAWLAALMFVVHPLQVEVVANISHRKDSLALAFSLLSILSYIKFCSGERGWKWLLLSLLLWAIALSAKLNAICLPAVFAAYEYGWVDRSRRFLLKRPLAYLWVGCLLAGGVGALYWLAFGDGGAIFMRETAGHLRLKANYFDAPSVSAYLRVMLKSWAFMFSKYLIPTGLAPEYTYPVPASWFDPWVVAASAGIPALFGLVVVFRRQPLVVFSLVMVAVFWLPVSNLWPLTYFAADRYMYAPSAGVFILLAFLLPQLFRGRVLLAVAVVVLPTLGFLTLSQVRIWQSPWTLWGHALEVSPQSTFALNNMGNNYLLKGDMDTALSYYEKSVGVNPTNPEVHYNLGLIYERKGAIRKALKHYRDFIALSPGKYSSQVEFLKERYNLE